MCADQINHTLVLISINYTIVLISMYQTGLVLILYQTGFNFDFSFAYQVEFGFDFRFPINKFSSNFIFGNSVHMISDLKSFRWVLLLD